MVCMGEKVEEDMHSSVNLLYSMPEEKELRIYD